MDFGILKSEITNDPLGRGYSTKTNEQIAADLNTAYRTTLATTINTSDFLKGMAMSEYIALTAPQQSYLSLLFGDGNIDIRTGSEARTGLLALFGSASVTRANLLALATVPITRGVELNIGLVTTQDVTQAKS